MLVGMILAMNQNSAFAESVSISASTSVSTEIKLEINSETEKKSSIYTGVIVDCRGLGFKF